MNASIQFLFDFGSPNAYLCHKVLPALEQRTSVAVQYVPVLLGGLFKLSNNRSPAETTAQIPNKRAYDALEMKRFIAKHAITEFKFNPFFPVNTLPIMRGAVAAQTHGCFAPYVNVMYAAMWEQGRNLGEASEVLAVLQSAGLDAKRLLEGSQDPAVKATLMANTQDAFERGAFGSPTFFVGEEMYFGKDRLADFEKEITAHLARA
ncbi:MAG: 2-hydroxychromene-2-carboxylate isomerase [Rhodoferax sp.]|uniref:2-hydroxychromene-2-carboxylate isomerase n=1 Tax=Rhodoferax sp. TaxID=50421 RepID=UPI0014003301|nr:2-hydroxychromene-2-carboxylate isomerase [Rhodoferax sp.]NDP40886.1 2-hydroxychromene-2-carboxylate isomerase [Rhodoferax sp.]